MKKLLAPGGPLGVFGQYPILLKFAVICVCAEMAWATLLIVMEFYFKEELLVEYSDQYIASKVAVAFLAFAGFETLFKYPMGTLADRYGPRPLVLLSLGICSITPLLMLAATKWFHVIPMRALDGFAAAALWPAMSALMARSVPREAKAAAMSVFNGAYCLGLAIGPMTGLFLGHLLGSNRWVFPFCALIMFTGLLVAYSTLGAPDKSSKAANGAVESHEIGIGAVLRGRPMLVRMMMLYALSQVAVGILAPTVPIYIDSQFGIKQKDLAGLIVIPAILIVLVALPLGSAADKIGRARAVWISYAMAALGMLMVATTSFFAPTRQLLSAPPLLFGGGILLLVMSYILGTPAWLGLTSLQVDDKRQAQALSLMQTSQGIGVVCAFVMVASAGHLMTQWNRVGAALKHQTVAASKSLDTVPLSVWFWVAAFIFLLCLIGTLLWVRETPHTAHEEERAQSAAQPLEITGIS
ncbi:MAG TPA: MFS transporter [Abditibacteriaceae bacterium]|jgi:MFS family permease